jgi:hypothetical protein
MRSSSSRLDTGLRGSDEDHYGQLQLGLMAAHGLAKPQSHAALAYAASTASAAVENKDGIVTEMDQALSGKVQAASP